MANPPRDEAHAFHHVMNQGVRKTDLYRDDLDRRNFIESIAASALKHRSHVIAYCLMGNHFHIVLRCDEGQLAPTMRDALAPYARSFNRRHGLTGPLFRSRYRSVAIATDEQLLATCRYVHRNPLELGYDIERYRWSSYALDTQSVRGPWLLPQLIFDLTGGPQSYRDFVRAPQPTDRFSVSDGVWSCASVGREADPIAAIISAVDAAAFPTHSASTRRAAALLIALEHARLTSDEIATSLGLRSGGVVRTLGSRARARSATDRDFGEFVARACDQLLTGPRGVSTTADVRC